ncbi:hypothetical protein MVEN_01462200 [Mycena venus]|uniref:Uncharacterized protein n=1 Tax=Mycena venus TaxID=2733690 RepID=A0A8H7CSX9_9AGAR|nr:hypothetical protein MVEN_01462200 [Mycena venus]
MWPPFPSRGRRPPSSTSKHKSPLSQSADAFPPLKSAVGGVLAVWDIAQRAKRCKSEARDIALRTKAILDVIADAVPDPSAIPQPMLRSIERFTVLLEEIRCTMEAISLAGSKWRIAHLNRNERVLQGIRSRLDDAYRDFVAASALRVEAQQAELAVQFACDQADTRIAVGKIAETLAPDLSRILFYCKLSTIGFFGHPLM